MRASINRTFTDVGELVCDPGAARVYEHGWQSWSPTLAYRLDERPFRPVSDLRRVGNYRPERSAHGDVKCFFSSWWKRSC